MLEGIATEIQELIDEQGRDVTVRTYVNSGPPHNPTRTPADVTARAVIANFRAEAVNESIVQADDKKAFISSVTAVTKQSKIVDGANEYQIVNLRLIEPGDEKFLYIAQCRK